MKVFLMHAGRDFGPVAQAPTGDEALIADLELGTLLRAMAGGDEFLHAVARTALLAGLADPAGISFRQQVLADCLREPGLVREIYGVAVAAIAAERRAYGGWFLPRSPEAVLHRGVEVLQAFAGHLRRLRQIAGESGARFTSAGFTRFFAMLDRELDDAYFAEIDEHLRRLRFRDGVLVSASLGTGNRGAGYTLRAPRPARRRLPFGLPGGRRSAFTLTIADRDEAGARALAELERRGIHLVADALGRSTDHILGFFTALRTELAFYLGCLNLHEQLARRDVPVCLPEPGEPAGDGGFAFSCEDLTEPCLALTAAGPVVGNDVAADGRPLVVITGANQGGKSTFLRSAGIAQLMMGAGMFVAARSYRASVSRGLFTHFTREEDATMTHGKLAEELARMSEIADRITPGCLLLCNESFAATNEREGSQIAREVITAMLDSGVAVFVVTHLHELARGLRAERGDGALFLRAEREADGSRPFRLAPGEPLPTSFGADLYHQVFADAGAPAATPGPPGRR